MAEIQQTTSQMWPVVLNSSLKNSGIYQLLKTNFKVRVAENTVRDTIIFPLSAVAFLILPLAQLKKEKRMEKNVLDPQFIERIEKFLQIHRHCYVIILSAQMDDAELQILTALQRSSFSGVLSDFVVLSKKKQLQRITGLPETTSDQRFFTSGVGFIPLHNNQECLDCMTSVAKVTCKPVKEIIQERLKRLEQSTVTEDVVLHILSNLGLSLHECLVLQHGCQTLSAVANATVEQLMDCSLDKQTALQIKKFFIKDSLPV